MQYTTQAASSGDRLAQYSLGALYLDVAQSESDLATARFWFQLAAAQNVKGAAHAVEYVDQIGEQQRQQQLVGIFNGVQDFRAARRADGQSMGGGVTGFTNPYAALGGGNAQEMVGSIPTYRMGRASGQTMAGVSGQRHNSLGTMNSFDEPPRSPNIGAINVRSGQFMAPAGPDSYVDPRNGTFYAPSGPNGVVNTRTGEYSPVGH